MIDAFRRVRWCVFLTAMPPVCAMLLQRLIAGDADTTAEAAAMTTEQLKETYVHYAKVLRTWFYVQRGHRLRRYTERWKLLASVAARPPAQQ